MSEERLHADTVAAPLVRPDRRRGVLRGLGAALSTALIVGELGVLVTGPHMHALQRATRGNDPQHEVASLLLPIYFLWWLLMTIWVGARVARGRDLWRLVLPIGIEVLLLVSLLLVLP